MAGDLAVELNRLAHTSGLDAQGAANAWANTVNLDLVGALNKKAGTTQLDLLGVLNKLANTTGLGAIAAAQAITGGVTAGLASGIGTAYNSSITLVGNQLSVNAGNAAGTGTSFNPFASTTGSVLAGNAAGTGAATNPAAALSVNAGNAAGTGAASNATISLGSTWTPISLPSLVALYQADNAGSITGSPVTQWNDLSGNARHLTVQTGMTSPTTGSSTINSLNAIGFNGTTQELGNYAVGGVGGNQHSFGAIFKSTGVASGFDRLLSLSATGASDYNNTTSIAAMLRDSSTAAWNGYYNNAARSTKAATDNAQHLLVCIRNGDTLDVYVDGAAGTQATGLGTTALNIAKMVIGNAIDQPSTNQLGASFYKGGIGVLAWSNAIWSSGDLASFLAYSQATWGTP